MVKIGFEFPRDDSQQWDGFNEPGIEHFSGSPFRSLGREGTQNAFDAARSAPARIEIRRIDVPTDSVPDISELKKVIKLCAQEALNEGDKAQKFFDEAKTLLAKPKVSVLQFADWNILAIQRLKAEGWDVMTVWECETDAEELADKLTYFLGPSRIE